LGTNRGESNKRIGGELKISIQTVADERANLMEKMQAMHEPDALCRCVLAAI
jgi:FixJ family two-component response regulator